PYVMGSKMEIKFILSPTTAALAFAIPIAVALAASVIPCLRVAKLSPIEAIRRGELHGSAAKGKKRSAGAQTGAFSSFRSHVNSATLALDEMRDHKAIYGTIIAVIAIALAVFMLQSAYQENFTRNITSAVRDTLSSDGMILAGNANYRSIFGGAPVIENATAIAKEIEQKTRYKAVARSNSQSVVEFIDSSGSMVFDGATFWGIDVKEDENVFDIKSKIIDGQYFDPDVDYGQNYIGEQAQQIPGVQFGGIGTMMIVQELETPYPVLAGATAAKAHDLQVGDEFTFLITNSKKGSGIVSCQFQVMGIYDTKMPIVDALMYFTPRIAINEMMGYGDNDGNAIVVNASGNPDYNQIYETMKSAAPDMQAFSWHEAVLFISGASFDALTLIIYTAIVITLTLVAIAIKYAMDSTVDRKTREIGMLKAIGARDRMVVKIFLYQGIFIGAASGLLAILLSYIAMYASINIFHIQSQLPLGMLLDVGFTITPLMIAITLLAPTAVSLMASYLPSRRAAKLSPVEALRKGELNM
ncbi:MAG: FtsX-like permease family protein, partial [Candidatus Thermoplasmatota archaeon]|nr:FtsX-like permease family protein [Candidatus Thermoplasmatota archaeon]